jgi:acyl carrier protein
LFFEGFAGSLRKIPYMEKHERITRAVLAAIGEMYPPVHDDPNNKDIRAIPLSGNLDSLGMISLIIGVEEALKKEFKREITILGQASALGPNPFKTSGALIDYIDTIV